MASGPSSFGESIRRDPSGKKPPDKTRANDKSLDPTRAAKHLQKLIVEKNAQVLAEHYANYLVALPNLALDAGPQYEMAFLFQQAGKDGLALLAYERLIKSAPDASVTVNALLAAGKICATLPAKYEDAERYLLKFLETKPLLRDYQEACRILEHVRQQMAAGKRTGSEAAAEEGQTPAPPVSEKPAAEEKAQHEPRQMPEEEEPARFPGILTTDIERFLQKDEADSVAADMENSHIERRADQTAALSPSERAELMAPKVFSPASETKTVASTVPAEPAQRVAPAEKPPVPPAGLPREILVESRFIIAIALGRHVKFPALVDIVSQHLQIDRTNAERRIVLGKGILFRDLDLPSTAQVLRILQKAEQSVVVVRVTPKIAFPSEREVQHCIFAEGAIRFILLGETVEVPTSEIILLCCGSVRLAAGGSPKSVLDIFTQEPKLLLRIWENTFDFRASNLNLPTFEEKNFLTLCKRCSADAPIAFHTGVFDKMIERELLTPQIFESLVEYDNYNLWHLLNFHGEKIEPKELLSAI